MCLSFVISVFLSFFFFFFPFLSSLLVCFSSVSSSFSLLVSFFLFLYCLSFFFLVSRLYRSHLGLLARSREGCDLSLTYMYTCTHVRILYTCGHVPIRQRSCTTPYNDSVGSPTLPLKMAVEFVKNQYWTHTYTYTCIQLVNSVTLFCR